LSVCFSKISKGLLNTPLFPVTPWPCASMITCMLINYKIFQANANDEVAELFALKMGYESLGEVSRFFFFVSSFLSLKYQLAKVYVWKVKFL